MKTRKLILAAIFILVFGASAFAAAASVEATAQTDKTRAKLGEVVRYVLTIKRQGDMSQAPSLSMPSFEGFRVQASYSNSMMNFENGAASATNQQTVDLIAVKTGDIVIAPAKVKFFDPVTKQYNLVQTKEITITVDSGKRHVVAADTPVPVPTQPPAEQDIRSIKYSVHIDLSELLPYIILAIIFIIAVYFIWKRILKKSEPKAAVMEEDYRRDALRRVKKAADILKKGEIKGYYSEIYEAFRWFLTRYFRDSFDELTTQEILKKMADKKCNAADLEASSLFMKECDLVKFADYRPAEKDIASAAADAEKLISDFK
jgi:hypothetical protein